MGIEMMILGLFYRHGPWASHSHCVDHELLCIPKYSRVKFETIHPRAKAWPKQLDNDLKDLNDQQIYNRMAEKEKNKGFADLSLTESCA